MAWEGAEHAGELFIQESGLNLLYKTHVQFNIPSRAKRHRIKQETYVHTYSHTCMHK